MPRSRKRAVHGILLLDKPKGLSSNEALQAAKRLYRAAKAGHTGSLDPMATGLLPLCFGEATKVASQLLGSHKAYEAECLLGITTDTDDAEGETREQREVPALDTATIEQALRGFVGTIDQVPPAFSALKRDGVRMYERARRGETVELEARNVTIHDIELLDWESPRLRFRVTCGSGTYIRSLARDLGAVLGCGAHLTALRRLWVDPFTTPVMHSTQALEALTPEALEQRLLPVDAGLRLLPAVHLDADHTRAMGHGQGVPLAARKPGRYRAYAHDGRLLALAERRADGLLHVVRGFNLPPDPQKTGASCH